MVRKWMLLLVAMLVSGAQAQSNEVSQASALSLTASIEAVALSAAAVESGSRLVVTALRPVGDVIEVSVAASATGVSTVLRISAKTVQAAGVVVGSALVVTASTAGYLIHLGAEAIAFVPNELAHAHIHHREL
jgi:hypothetical protein